MSSRRKPLASPSSGDKNSKQKSDRQGVQWRRKRHLAQALGEARSAHLFVVAGQDTVGLIRRSLHVGLLTRA